MIKVVVSEGSSPRGSLSRRMKGIVKWTDKIREVSSSSLLRRFFLLLLKPRNKSGPWKRASFVLVTAFHVQ